MSTNSVTPILQHFVLCDAIAVTPDGKVSYLGIFDAIARPKVHIPQFNVVTNWVNGVGEHTARIRFLNPHLKEVSPQFEGKFNLAHRVDHAQQMWNFVNFVFEERGVYWFEVLLNDSLVASIPLPVGKKAARSV